MKQRVKRIIFISVLLLLVLSISAAIYLYNKGPLDVRSSSGKKVSATELYSVFMNDSLQAGEAYTSKVLLVTGEVAGLSVNTNKQKIILIKTGLEGAYVNCTLDEPADNIVPAAEVSIKGICSGIGQGEPDLGIRGDVYLTRCVIAKK